MMDEPRLPRQFREYDMANPQIYELFKRFSLEAIKAGRRKLSASLITERIRWEVFVVVDTDDEFKINNNWRSFYARKFMNEFPEYDGVFATRSSVADEVYKEAA